MKPMPILIIMLTTLAGCASTTIDTPIGRYTSTRDSALDELLIVIDRQADGSEHTEVMVGGATGGASGVINAQADLLGLMLESAFQLGVRSAGAR